MAGKLNSTFVHLTEFMSGLYPFSYKVLLDFI